jgi:acetoin utilization protein AcuB
MTSDPVTVNDNVAALEAFDRMVDAGIRHLPVVDGRRRLIGVLSSDGLRGAFPFELSTKRPLGPLERSQVLDHRVSDAMTWAPKTVRADTSLEQAARCQGRIPATRLRAVPEATLCVQCARVTARATPAV